MGPGSHDWHVPGGRAVGSFLSPDLQSSPRDHWSSHPAAAAAVWSLWQGVSGGEVAHTVGTTRAALVALLVLTPVNTTAATDNMTHSQRPRLWGLWSTVPPTTRTHTHTHTHTHLLSFQGSCHTSYSPEGRGFSIATECGQAGRVGARGGPAVLRQPGWCSGVGPGGNGTCQ